jgi:hypothetical protein
LKKLIWSLEILVFLFVNFANMHAVAQEVPIKRSYLVRDAADYRIGMKYTLDPEHRVEVIAGQWGATLTNEEKIKYFSGDKPVIWTIPETMDSARVAQDQLLKTDNIETEIHLIPERYYQTIMGRARSIQEGLASQLIFETAEAKKKIADPKQTVQNSFKILRANVVKPNPKRLNYTRVYTYTPAGVTAYTAFFVTGVNPAYAIALTIATLLFTGVKTHFSTTFNNLIQADMMNDFRVSSNWRQWLSRLTLMGLVFDEMFYGLGHSLSEGAYTVSQAQLLTNTVITGHAATAATFERRKYPLPSDVDARLGAIFFAWSMPIAVLSAMGLMSQPIFDFGPVKFTYLHAQSLISAGAMIYISRYKNDNVVQLYREGLKKTIRDYRFPPQRKPAQLLMCMDVFH